MARGRAEFTQLMEELEDLDLPPREGSAEEGRQARRAEIQTRLLELLAAEVPDDERRRLARVACNLLVLVRAGGRARAGIVLDIGVGGAFVQTTAYAECGDPVELEVERHQRVLTRGLRVPGRVAWRAQVPTGRHTGLGVAFCAPPHADGVRRFVLELLRKRG